MIQLKAAKLLLHEEHQNLGAQFMEFAGWQVPVYYTSIVQEHKAVREKVGIFDVSHMGEIHLAGEKSRDFLQYLVCNDLGKLRPDQALYTPLMNEKGGMVDDILIFQINPQHFFLIVNAANIEKDFRWLKERNNLGLEIDNLSEKRGILALQGPESKKIIEELFGWEAAELAFHHFVIKRAFEGAVVISRSGYTGEIGFELFFNKEQAHSLWDKIFEVGKKYDLVPVGFGARDTLRLEAHCLLYGQDIDEETTPLEAGLDWTVSWTKGDFLGREVLLKQKKEGIKRKLIGFELGERGIPRTGCEIKKHNQLIGKVTSGTFAPSLKKAIGLGYVPVEFSKVGTEIEIVIRAKSLPAKVVETPFYKTDTVVRSFLGKMVKKILLHKTVLSR